MLFEKYFLNKNNDEFLLTASSLTKNAFRKYKLQKSDTSRIGYDAKFLFTDSKVEYKKVQELDLDSFPSRLQNTEYSIFGISIYVLVTICYHIH